MLKRPHFAPLSHFTSVQHGFRTTQSFSIPTDAMSEASRPQEPETQGEVVRCICNNFKGLGFPVCAFGPLLRKNRDAEQVTPPGKHIASCFPVMAPKYPDRISHLISVRGNVPIMTSHNSLMTVMGVRKQRKTSPSLHRRRLISTWPVCRDPIGRRLIMLSSADWLPHFPFSSRAFL